MLPTPIGCVHLSVSNGCGGTTWALQQAKYILMKDLHVIWICDKIPDGDRFSQICSDLPPSLLSRLHVSANGDNTELGVKSGTRFLSGLSNIGLVIVDNWAPRSGKPPASLKKSMEELVNSCSAKKIPLIAISSSYEDVANGGWKARSGLKSCEIWFLHKNEVDTMVREIHHGELVTRYRLDDSGFSPRN